MSDESNVHVLYDWVCRMEDDVHELKSAFPDWLDAERNRLIASLRCFRVTMEIRVAPRFPKRQSRPQRAALPHKASSRPDMID